MSMPPHSGTPDNLPDWAGFFSGEDYRIFMAEVRQTLEESGVPHEVDPPAGVVRAEPSLEFGLMNLAQNCRHVDRGQWPEMVREHFSRVLSMSGSEPELIEELKGSFARARSMLRVRLYPDDMVGQEWSVCRPVADGIVAMLVYDLPQSVVNVQREHATHWRVSDDELFAQALRNIREEEKLELSPVDVGEGLTLQVLEGAGFYTASHALFLEEYLDPANPFGALVSIPHRGMILLHPIEDGTALQALRPLLYLTPELYAAGPGSISDRLYWWRGGTFTHLPCVMDEEENTANFSPPAEFVEEVLNRLTLAEPDEASDQ